MNRKDRQLAKQRGLVRQWRAKARWYRERYDKALDEMYRWRPAARVVRINDAAFLEDNRQVPRTQGVYILHALGTDRYKIGFTRDFQQRIRGLRLGSPLELAVVLLLEGAGESNEIALHARFAGCRIHGEWFSATPELLAFIADGGE